MYDNVRSVNCSLKVRDGRINEQRHVVDLHGRGGGGIRRRYSQSRDTGHILSYVILYPGGRRLLLLIFPPLFFFCSLRDTSGSARGEGSDKVVTYSSSCLCYFREDLVLERETVRDSGVLFLFCSIPPADANVSWKNGKHKLHTLDLGCGFFLASLFAFLRVSFTFFLIFARWFVDTRLEVSAVYQGNVQNVVDCIISGVSAYSSLYGPSSKSFARRGLFGQSKTPTTPQAEFQSG